MLKGMINGWGEGIVVFPVENKEVVFVEVEVIVDCRVYKRSRNG